MSSGYDANPRMIIQSMANSAKNLVKLEYLFYFISIIPRTPGRMDHTKVVSYDSCQYYIMKENNLINKMRM